MGDRNSVCLLFRPKSEPNTPDFRHSGKKFPRLARNGCHPVTAGCDATRKHRLHKPPRLLVRCIPERGDQRLVGQNPTVIHQDNAATETLRLVHIMCREYDRQPVFLKPSQHLPDILADLRIKSGGGLIKN
jgi:hypothetical protein